MEQEFVLPEVVLDGVEEALTNPDSPIATEFEVGDPDGIFIGVAKISAENEMAESGEDEVVVYVYLPDRRAHNEFDKHTRNMDEPNGAMFEESLQLNRISTELLSLLDDCVGSICIDDDTFEPSSKIVEDDLEPKTGEYYAVSFPISDIEISAV